MSHAPLILVVPALGVAPAYYQPFVDALIASLDAEVTVLPLPRMSSWRERWFAPRRLGYAQLVRTIRDELARLRASHPSRPVFLIGHSIGGQAGVLAAALDDTLVDGVALVACGTPYWRAWPAAQRREAGRAIRLIDWVSRCLPWYPGRLIGFGGDQPRQLMRDWVSTARTGGYGGIAGSGRWEAALATARLSVLALRIEGDSHAPESAVDHLLHKLPRAHIERAVATSARLARETPERRHIVWLREPVAVVPALADWMGRVSAGASTERIADRTDAASHAGSDCVSLDKGSLLSIASPLGCRIECVRGSIWITHDGDLRDMTLSAHDSHLADRRGRMLVQALEPCALRIRPPRRADVRYALRPARLPLRAARLAG